MRAFELLFFAVFGQTYPETMRVAEAKEFSGDQPEWTVILFKIVTGIYMLLSVVVFINLLIAMMSDTYQRIQVNFPDMTATSARTVFAVLLKTGLRSLRHFFRTMLVIPTVLCKETGTIWQ